MGTAALPEGDFTGRVVLTGLPPGQQVFYRVRFRDLDSPKVVSPPAEGRFRSAPSEKGDVRFAWSGDTAGRRTHRR